MVVACVPAMTLPASAATLAFTTDGTFSTSWRYYGHLDTVNGTASTSLNSGQGIVGYRTKSTGQIAWTTVSNTLNTKDNHTIALNGWALVNGGQGQDRFLWSINNSTWYKCEYYSWTFKDAGTDITTSNQIVNIAQLSSISAANGRFGDLTINLSDYAGQTISVTFAIAPKSSDVTLPIAVFQNVKVNAHTPSEWQKDSGGHWKYCTLCNATTTAKTSHSGTAATCTTEQKCSTCGYKMADKNSSNHTGSVVNGGTSGVHTKYNCCGATVSTTHSYTSKVTTAATCTTKGTTTYTCGCGYSYTSQNVAINASNHSGSVVNGGTSGVHTKYNCCGATVSTTHSYTSKVTTAATCTTNGVRTYTCGCGYSYTETIAATGHTAGAAATCTTAQTCTVCGTQLAPAKGHTAGAAATCTTAQTCTVCGTTIVAATGHSYTNYKSNNDATCTEDGTKTATCDNGCGTKSTVTDVGSAKGHTPGAEATCTSPQTCTVCGTQLAPTTGHSWSGWSTITPPTCSTPGEQSRECSVCHTKETQEIAALAHDEISHAGKTPTCAEPGWAAYVTCSRCDYTTYRELPATGAHAYAFVQTVKATCTQKGYDLYKCTACNSSSFQNIAIEYGHNYDGAKFTTIKPATCTKTGIQVQYCTRGCGVYSNQQTIPMTDHTADVAASCIAPQTCINCGTHIADQTEHTPGDAATCTTSQTCTKCGTILAFATGVHTEVVLAGRAPTCNETGLTDGIYCSVCDLVLISNTVIPATGRHNPGAEATCTTAQICVECELVISPATGHRRIEITQAYIAPTCTTEGRTAEIACIDCKNGEGSPTYYVSQSEVIPALNHDWKDATCLAPKTCKACGATEGEVADHDSNVELPAVEATCIETGLTVGAACSVCGAVTDPQEVTPKANHTSSNTPAPYCIICDIDLPAGCTHDYSGDCDADCDLCGEIRDNVSEHIIIVIVEFMQPTCTRAGRSEGTGCQKCGCVMIASVTIAKLGHDYVEITVNATCTEAGYTLHRCMNKLLDNNGDEINCPSSYKTDYTSALDHKIDEESAYECLEIAATCVSDGYEMFVCSLCSFSYKDILPATGSHNYTPEKATTIAATCTAQGYTIHACANENCGSYYIDSVVSPSGTHAFVIVETVAASCTERGHTLHRCSGCGLEQITNVTVVAHSYTENVVAAGTNTYGYTEYTCTGCNKSYKTSFEAPTNYTYSVTDTHPLGGEYIIPDNLTFYVCDQENEMWYVVLKATS